MIEMKHINLSFRNKDLFTDQEIKIDSGKITLITGESGSGKSTLLFELARLTDYANKEYIYENEKMSDLDEESFRKKSHLFFKTVDFLMIYPSFKILNSLVNLVRLNLRKTK